jgi:hypothetical protein
LQSVRFRFAIHSHLNGECHAILWQRVVTLRGPVRLIGFACDCVPSGQSHGRNSLGRKQLLQARIF